MADGTNTAEKKPETPPPTMRQRAQGNEQRNAQVLHILKRQTGSVKSATASGIGDGDSGPSKQLGDDPFAQVADEGRVIETPFDMLTLSMLTEHSTEMGQCVDAMEVNIDGFGHRFLPRASRDSDSDGIVDETTKKAARVEHVRLENFFRNASVTDTFTQLRRKMRRDLETTGNGYWEVLRDRVGRISGFEHAPSHLIRLGGQEKEATRVEQPIIETQEDGSMQISKRRVWRRFRTFVQSRATFRNGGAMSAGFQLVWFKEFGDPRNYDSRTGKQIADDDLEKFKTNGGDRYLATELLHFKIYAARTPYGLPRFIGNLISIFGSRAAEEINFLTFKNNNIPSMAVLVANGQLTQGTIDRIAEFTDSQIQGSSNYSKFLLLEAEGAIEGEDAGNVTVEIKPLTSEQHTDALFTNYQKANQQNLRCSWRLPPIFVGRTDDYTRSTADSSRRLADEQVFGPERDAFDEVMNKIVLPEMGVVYWSYRTNSPNTTDNAEMVSILSGAERTGGMTPKIARNMLSEIFNRELPPFQKTKDFDPDLPFSLSMAQAVKSQADPSQPGQTVTALKSIHKVTGLVEAFTGIPVTVEGLLAERDRIEEEFTKALKDRDAEEHNHHAAAHH